MVPLALFHGTMVPWQLGTMLQWYHGTLAPWLPLWYQALALRPYDEKLKAYKANVNKQAKDDKMGSQAKGFKTGEPRCTSKAAEAVACDPFGGTMTWA